MSSLIRVLREDKGISQRRLSQLSGISRGRLQRLENGQFATATYAELEKIAKALDLDVGKIFRASHPASDSVYQGKLGENFFHYQDPNGGCSVISQGPPQGDVFMVKVILSGRKSIPSRELPPADTVFLQAVIGAIQVFVDDKPYDIPEGDHLIFSAKPSYSLYNPSIHEQISVLFLTKIS